MRHELVENSPSFSSVITCEEQDSQTGTDSDRLLKLFSSKNVSFCQTLYFALQNRYEDIFDFVNMAMTRILVNVIV